MPVSVVIQLADLHNLWTHNILPTAPEKRALTDALAAVIQELTPASASESATGWKAWRSHATRPMCVHPIRSSLTDAGSFRMNTA